jgi:hypothetical protein
MAYMNQEKKAKIAAALKNVVPKGWKYSLAVRNHSSIVMNIKSAPVDLVKAFGGDDYISAYSGQHVYYADVNPYHYRNHLGDHDELKDVFDKIFEALNIDNFDESDIMTDYFHVGHYVNVNVGSFNKPLQVK